MPKALEHALSIIDRVCMGGAQAALLLMMLSISADGIGRYFFNQPFQGNYEITCLYFMVILTFLGMPVTYIQGYQIRIEMLRPYLSRIPGNPLERMNALLAAVGFGFLAWHSGELAIEKFVMRETTFGMIQLPLYWSYVWVPLGSGLLALRLAIEIVIPRQPRSKKEEAPI